MLSTSDAAKGLTLEVCGAVEGGASPFRFPIPSRLLASGQASYLKTCGELGTPRRQGSFSRAPGPSAHVCWRWQVDSRSFLAGWMGGLRSQPGRYLMSGECGRLVRRRDQEPGPEWDRSCFTRRRQGRSQKSAPHPIQGIIVLLAPFALRHGRLQLGR